MLNADAADMLIKNDLYAPSIHCMYYSCFQMSMTKLNESGIDYETQKEEADKKNEDGRSLGSHNYTIQKTKSIVSDWDTYSRGMRQLKRLRRKSDYDNNKITELDAKSAYGYMQDVLSLLVS